METSSQPVSPLRQRMLEDMRMRKLAPKTMTLAADEFMRRFLLHVLPMGFHRIRHFDLIANNGRKEKLALARELLNVVPAIAVEITAADTTTQEPTKPNFVCAHCGAQMLVVESFLRGQTIRAPP